MRKRLVESRVLICLVLLGGVLVAEGQQPSKSDVPDAPSASRPIPKLPPPSQAPETAPVDNPEPAPPANAPPPSSQGAPQPSADQDQNPAGPAPPFPGVTTVPQGQAPQEGAGTQQELFRITRNVNQVLIPVRVQDDNGLLISGLLPTDFSIFEDSVKQKMNFFTSDPFALSVAVVIDIGMPDVALERVNKTYAALQGAFSQYDEVAVYTYSSTYSKANDYNSAGKTLTATLNSLRTVTGRNNGPPVTSGPLGPQGPTINNIPVQPNTPAVITPPKESHVMNDAILAAATDLARRERSRRKIIFVISDGREYGSQASYSDVLKVLLTNNILVYAIGVDSASIPGYSKLARLHIPKLGYSDILPKYTNATGGELFTEFTQASIERVYARAMGDARNMYTLGYVTPLTPSSSYRQIEVRVSRPAVKVFAKDGYYPLPPARSP